MSAELRVDRLVKLFSGGRPAVDDVGFRVAAGEIVVLLGPSGCGKTTTLRCIAGLEDPTSGEILIGGVTVSAPEQGILCRHAFVTLEWYSCHMRSGRT